MKKTVLTAVLISIFSFSFSISHAQRFEWAKGYGTGNPSAGNCHIAGSVTDSLGNLYILGEFRNDSEWDGEPLLPMTPYGPWPDNINTIIAKISPDGEMVWKKVIHSNNGSNQMPQDIKKVGDTAFACLLQLLLPCEDRYTYYLDTLILDRSEYPVSCVYYGDSFNAFVSMRTAFIMFDFEGNVIEQHFLYQTYTDTAGKDYVKYYSNDTMPWMRSDRYMYPSFDIDYEGNIYICRASMDRINDSINAQNGTIRGIKFWVDNRKVGEYINENRPMFWYPQIMKFSPHFDTMLACRYVVQKNNEENDLIGTQTKVDKYGNVYFIAKMYENYNNNASDTIVIDSLQNMSFSYTDMTLRKDFLVQFDSNLTPNWLITLDDSLTGLQGHSILLFGDIDFDYDSNLLFLYASTGRGHSGDTTNFYSILTYQGAPLNLKSDAFFMAFNISKVTPELYSYGRVPSVAYSDNITSGITRDIIKSKNNRIFVQTRYNGGIHLPDSFVDFNDLYTMGLGFVVFDYQGTVIGGSDYASFSTDSHPGPIALHDSILYFMGQLDVDATFGDIPFSTNGRQYAYIAQYIDTAFMSPYTGDIGDVNITLVPDVGVFTAYPNPFRQRVNINIENTELKTVGGRVTAMLTDITGRSEEVPLAPQGGGRYILDLTARPQASYLLTLNTADGRQHTVRLLKQSDRFGDQ